MALKAACVWKVVFVCVCVALQPIFLAPCFYFLSHLSVIAYFDVVNFVQYKQSTPHNTNTQHVAAKEFNVFINP